MVLTSTQQPFGGKITCVDSKFVPPVQCQKGKDALNRIVSTNHFAGENKAPGPHFRAQHRTFLS